MNVTLPARLDEIDRVCDELRGFLESQGRGGGFFELSLMLREALVNAVVHGCGGDADQVVSVSVRCDDREIVMTVEDPGPGFDWRRLQGQEADVWQDHGRGMLIFRCYASDVQYNETGNRVTLRKSW